MLNLLIDVYRILNWADGLNAEHLLYAHSYNDFGFGKTSIVIPLIKDKTGNVNNVNNYRGITLILVISNLFELVLLEICEQFLRSDEL